MPGEVRFTATEGDYVAANQLWHGSSKRQRWLLWLGVAGVLLAIGNIASRTASGDSFGSALGDSVPILFFAAICVGMRVLTPVMLPRQVRKMMTQNVALREPVHVSWDEEALNMAGSNGTAHLRWDRLHRLLVDDRTFVFLQTDRLMFIVPTRILNDGQIKNLRATALASGLLKH